MKKILNWVKQAANQARFEMRQNQFLPSSAKLDDDLGSRHIIASIATVCIIITALLLWSMLVSIDETADAQGQIIPQAKISSIQHLEGGIVKKITVNNGDYVKQGQVLMILDNTAAASEYDQSLTKEISLLVEIERLKSFLKGDDKDFKSILNKLMQEKRFHRFKDTAVSAIYKEEKVLLESQRLSQKDKRSVIQSQILKEEDHVHHLVQQKILLKKRIALLKEEENMFHTLRNKEVVSKREHLRVLRDVNQSEQDILKLEGNIATAKRALEELNNKMNQLNSELQESAHLELGNLTAQLLQTQENIKKLKDKVQRHVIKSPVDGVVKGIELLPGGVIGAGQKLMEVVPQNSIMVAEVKIKSRDIGHVKEGDPVNLKVTTYDFARFGTVKGKLGSVSATSFDSEDGEPYYKATVHLNRQSLKRGDKQYPLKSGMMVQANIKTHSKTLFEYIVKPIQVSLDNGFHER